MIVNEPAVCLSRRNLGEADRLCTLYSESRGKIAARFIGVNKAGRKLKALSEPMAWCEYRLYLSPRTEVARAVGGALVSTFPALRGDLGALVGGLACCERLDALTLARAPNPDKYRLICSALAALEERVSPWVPTAFALQLLELCGHGLRERASAGEDAGLWRRVHETALDALAAVPFRADAAERFARAADDEIEALAGRALKARGYAAKLGVEEPARC